MQAAKKRSRFPFRNHLLRRMDNPYFVPLSPMKKFFRIFFLTTGSLVVLYIAFFLVVLKLDRNAVDEAQGSQTNVVQQAVLLPSFFLNGERFYIKVRSITGDTLLALGDSGGGICFMNPTIVDKLGLRHTMKTALWRGMLPLKYLPFSKVVQDPQIPLPQLPRYRILRRGLSRVAEPFLVVPDMDREMQFMTAHQRFDIFLGQNFFMGHSWTIDYPRQQLWVNTPLTAGMPGVHKIGFRKNSTGGPLFGHPSTTIEVDGVTLDVLFDTGASLVLSEEGKKAFHTSEQTAGGSFIAASVFDQWRKKHPDWKYYPKADLAGDVIEVPAIKIAGYEVGPVLFARRLDEAWSEGMISSMDKVVKGAIGGSGLKYLKVTIDYNSELIRFEQ